MTRGQDSQAGFSLVEVLVAITLMGMLAVVIGQAARLGGRAWAVAEQRTTDVDDMDAVQALLRRSLQRAQPAFADATGPTVAFTGEPDALSLVLHEPGTAGDGAWVRARLYLLPRGATRTLAISWEPEPAGAANVTGPVRLLENVAALRLRYFGATTDGAAPAWQDHWADAARLPAMVRIGIQRDDPKLPPWPDLFVTTRITTNAGCLYDGRGGGCRRAAR